MGNVLERREIFFFDTFALQRDLVDLDGREFLAFDFPLPLRRFGVASHS